MLVVDQLDKISVSFLAHKLEIRRGGVAANISFGMANLGQRPVLVGSVGEDFADYRSWLERHGVNCDHVHISTSAHTARFVCTTDDDMAQIATFYAGAMSEAREIELAPIADRVGPVDFVLVGPNDPDAMVRHTEECRQRGYRFIGLDEAMRDKAYQRADAYTDPAGPSWLHRWAIGEKKPPAFFAGEPTVPEWVLNLARLDSE